MCGSPGASDDDDQFPNITVSAGGREGGRSRPQGALVRPVVVQGSGPALARRPPPLPTRPCCAPLRDQATFCFDGATPVYITLLYSPVSGAPKLHDRDGVRDPPAPPAPGRPWGLGSGPAWVAPVHDSATANLNAVALGFSSFTPTQVPASTFEPPPFCVCP
jgi:hypothetical protein